MTFLPLYGELRLEPEIWELVGKPLCQRLRHIRLSNIDSLSSPGVAGVSRYEHSLGAAHLAGLVSCGLTRRSKILLQAAALIHDAGITPFGHLVEEALACHGDKLSHENIWQELSQHSIPGGLSFQILGGRESGLPTWAEKMFGVDAAEALRIITGAVKGEGEIGALVSGSLDVDNIDNVCRAAFHMGVSFDPKLPVALARSIVAVSSDGCLCFDDDGEGLIVQWLDLRREVYERFMLSRRDFVLKAMLISATVGALECGELEVIDWRKTDHQFICALESSTDEHVADTLRRWLVADLWACSQLYWVVSEPPPLKDVSALSREVSEGLGRKIFCYRIVDKRYRVVEILTGGKRKSLGCNKVRWLFGATSPIRRPFKGEEEGAILDAIRLRYDASDIIATTSPGSAPRQSELFA